MRLPYHLAYHLIEAGRQDELFTLLTAGPDWMTAKFAACVGDAAYVDDLTAAMECFSDPVEDADAARTLVDLHTARQVVHARTNMYTDKDLEILVWLRREEEAIAIARLRDEPKKRFDGLHTILQTLHERDKSLNQEVLSLCQSIVPTIRDAAGRAEALSVIATQFIRQGDEYASTIIQQALDIAHDVNDNPFRKVFVLNAIAAQLAKQGNPRSRIVFQQALDIAHTIEHVWGKALVFSDIATQLAVTGHFQQALDIVNTIDGDDLGSRAKSLRAIVAQLAAAGDFQQALDIARTIGDARERSFALSTIATQLAQQSNPQADTVFQQALDTAHAIDDAQERSSALYTAAAQLAVAGHFQQALDIVNTIDNDSRNQAEALRAIAVYLAQQGDPQADVMLQQALNTVQIIHGPAQLYALRTIINQLVAAGQFQQALDTAQIIHDARHQVLALRAIVAQLAAAGRFQQALDTAKTSLYNDIFGGRSFALSTITIQLTTAGQVHLALDTAQAIYRAENRAEALSAIAVHLARHSDPQANVTLQEALETAQGIDSAWSRAKALSAIAAQLALKDDPQNSAIFQQALDIAYTIDNTETRATALRDIAAKFTAAKRFQQAIDTVHNIDDTLKRAEALCAIAVQLATAGHFQRAVDIVHNIDDTLRRADALSAIAAQLAAAGHFQRALEMVRTIDDAGRRADALCTIAAAFVKDGQWQRGLETLGPRKLNTYLQWLAEQHDAFEAIAPGLTLTVLREAVRIVAWHNPNWRPIHEILSRPLNSTVVCCQCPST